MTRRSWLMVMATAAVWGSSYMFIKIALDDFSGAGVVFIRTALGAVLLLSIAAHRRVLGALRGRLRWTVAIALIQVVGPFLLIAYGETYISSSLTAILISSLPIFTALLALGFDHTERAHGWGLVGIAVGMLGVVLLFGVDLAGDSGELLGGGMMVLASLCYAISWLLVKHKMAGAPPEAVAGGTMVVAAVVTAPMFAASPPAAAPDAASIGSLVALGAGGTGVAFILYYTLIADIGPARASMVSYVAPGFSILYGVLLLGETLTVWAIAGLLLILAGSWLGAERRPPWRRRDPALSRSGPSRSSAPAPARAR